MSTPRRHHLPIGLRSARSAVRWAWISALMVPFSLAAAFVLLVYLWERSGYDGVAPTAFVWSTWAVVATVYLLPMCSVVYCASVAGRDGEDAAGAVAVGILLTLVGPFLLLGAVSSGLGWMAA